MGAKSAADTAVRASVHTENDPSLLTTGGVLSCERLMTLFCLALLELEL